MTDTPTTAPNRLDVADAEGAATLPCLLAAGTAEVIEPWLATRQALDPDELRQLLTIVATAADRLSRLAVRDLPDADDALVGALTLRLWLLGVAASAATLSDIAEAAVRDRAADADSEQARQRLQARYLDNPTKARNDGLDVLAGSLLA